MTRSITPVCIFLFISLSCSELLNAQAEKQKDPVYVDNTGVMRWSSNKKEAVFFGVNYTVPFAYGYRSHKALGVDIEKAIDNDVYHFARLGLDAFRVHIWDVEISDTLGNLLNNEHLRLFDYLLSKLKERHIKTIITPIAFWGNGYPERDEKTPGFATLYGKDKSVVNPAAIKAQENYMRQILQHVNPYTKKTYSDDEDIIAMEINNEPHHSGPKQGATDYINHLANAARATGWTKPIFYNISESPFYSDAIGAANVNGHSFQWYPTGLVAGHNVKGNSLPNVDQYYIPFDTVQQFKKRARMVYEFDAGDILDPIMYPAMARSFRTAGFQWATQFAYDPMATAYANTEYQTHYLNLAYTPAKAISLLIASKAFHRLPRLKSYGTYPVDSVFDVFRVSYRQSLSEMNSDEEFYYSNSTDTKPANATKLQHIAGVGSSSLVQYNGTGAYFLDKISNGAWRLEVMPDAVFIRDPFERASPSKEVTSIQWGNNQMKIVLADLGPSFNVKGINTGNTTEIKATNSLITIQPGTYILSSSGIDVDVLNNSFRKNAVISLNEFVAPSGSIKEPFVQHIPLQSVSDGLPFMIAAKITGLDTADKVSVELRHSSNRWKAVSMSRSNVFEYKAEVPVDMVTPGELNYRFIIQKPGNNFFVFPGAQKGNPYSWDAVPGDTWHTFVASSSVPLELFNVNTDRNNITIYNTDWRNNRVEYITVDEPGQLVLDAIVGKPAPGKLMGLQMYLGDKLKGRETEISSFDKIVIRAGTTYGSPIKLKIGFGSKDGFSYTANVTLTGQFREIELPLSDLRPDVALLLPRPYPGFLPLWFKSTNAPAFNLIDADKLSLVFGEDVKESSNPYSVQIEYVRLVKTKK
ncbi:MAG: membrane or secreted protein [Flavisolibacter sp.]